MTGQVVTANYLRDGDVVYLAEDGQWTLWLDKAWVAKTETALKRLLKIAEDAENACKVISIYAMPVGEGPVPLDALSARERIRAKGPTTRLDLGKQADPGFSKQA